MRAIILAAGRGERMLPLTRTTPKPMLQVGGKPLIQYQVERLVAAGISDMVINHAIMGEQIEAYLGDGRQFGASIRYSAEGDTPLDTAGGIKQALALMGEDPFIAVNADIWTDYPFQQLISRIGAQAHVVLTDNPPHHAEGDFCLEDGRVSNWKGTRLTFTGIGVYQPRLFGRVDRPVFALGELLRQAIEANEVTGEYYGGLWVDIGTPDRLDQLRESLK